MSNSHPVPDIEQLKRQNKQVINTTLKQRFSKDLAKLQITKPIKTYQVVLF